MNEIPSLTLLLIAGLAVARLTSLIVHDDIFEGIRHRVFLLSPPDEEAGQEFYSVVDWRGRARPTWRSPGFVGRLISCTNCTAVWVAAGVYSALHALPARAVVPVLIVAALAQISEATIKASR